MPGRFVETLSQRAVQFAGDNWMVIGIVLTVAVLAVALRLLLHGPADHRSGLPRAMQRQRIIFVVGLWAAVVGAWSWYRSTTGLGTTGAAQGLVESASGSWWAALAFLALSVLRPFVLIPATLLTMAAGLMFGPFVGVAVAAVGANASAMVGHTLGESFVRQVEGDGRISRWRGRLAENSFEAVLLMRLLFLPYDLVNYAAGYLRVRRWPFLAATAIGSLPGTVSFVLLGASLTDLADGAGGLDTRLLVVSVLLIATSLMLSRALRRRAVVDAEVTEAPRSLSSPPGRPHRRSPTDRLRGG